MIIGTAGHIDHGKTSLVRALTGVDTDRLPEEKKRGITIELGYAYLPTPQGDMLGFVDVPGHERFLHTMLAGATGIDFGLLVVAADDGVMPQTREHLDVLHLLGVAHGAVAITKMDRVDAARLAEVEAELRNLLAPTALADVPFFPVCSLSGQGVDDLRQHLFASANAATAPALDGRFRLAVDRSFTLEGLGTVVTGYVVSGSVRVDDNLILAPRAANTSVRVRGLRALNRAVDCGVAGQRCALNLAGIERSEVARGDWVVDAASALASERWDVRLKLLPGEAKPLRTGAQVHVHVGAWHGMARVVTLEGNNIEPGQSALAQLVLDRPASAWHGDRLILRDASAQRTLGGGQVIDPLGPARYRRTPERLAQLAALELADPVASLSALAAVSPLGVDVAQFLRCRDRHPLPANIHLPGLRRLSAEGVDIVFTDAEWQKLSERVLAETARFHETHPEDIGLDAGRLKRQAFPKLADRALTALVAALVAEGRLARQGVWLQLPVHAEQLGAQDQRLAQRILPLLVDGRFDPPWVRDIAKSIDTPESMVRGVLNRMARRGETFQVVKDLHYSPAAMREAALLAERLQAEHGAIRAAEFRDGTNLGRKRAIQILEYFDRIGFTRRLGDDHVIRSRALLIPEAANASASSAPP